jgi:hypothetical protein
VYWLLMEYPRVPQARKVCLFENCSTYGTSNSNNTSKPFMRYTGKYLHYGYYTKTGFTLVLKRKILLQVTIVCSGQLIFFMVACHNTPSLIFFCSGKFWLCIGFYIKY